MSQKVQGSKGKLRKVSILDGLIIAGENIAREGRNSSAFEVWRRDVEDTMGRLFADDPARMRRLDDIEYRPVTYSSHMADNRYDEAFQEGMKATLAELRSGRNTVYNFHDDEEDEPVVPAVRVRAKKDVKNTDRAKVFISHSEVDGDLADALVDMLKSTLKLVETGAIFCSSTPGHGLGIHGVRSEIRQKIKDAPVFIALLTPASVASRWVLIEMGAAWGYKTKGILPLITGGLDVHALPGPYNDLSAVEAKDVNVRANVADKLAHVGKSLGRAIELSGDPQRRIDQFVAAFQAANIKTDESPGDRPTGLFVRMKGVLWQVLDDGIDDHPYCMKCYAGLTDDSKYLYMLCGGCGLKSNILYRERHSVRDEVANALRSGSLKPFHLPLPGKP